MKDALGAPGVCSEVTTEGVTWVRMGLPGDKDQEKGPEAILAVITVNVSHGDVRRQSPEKSREKAKRSKTADYICHTDFKLQQTKGEGNDP